MGLKSSGSGGGEIVQVQGGHLVRATGRKDRHSKVYTAKGPRDRRVRLSAHTAIQFYDVQDRLGYDRPSKAVDWLIKKAKSAIDKLNESQELPSHDDHAGKAESSEPNFHMVDAKDDENQQVAQFSSSLVAPMATLDPEDAMKTFFPTSSSNSNINFQTYPHDIISRTANLNQELGLSLHPSFHGNTGQASSATDQTLFSTFDANNFQRMTGWNSELTPEQRGFLVNSSHQASVATLLNHQQTLFLGQGPPLLSHQRGTLQSSFSQPFRSWDHHHTDNHQHHQQQQQPSMFASHFGSHGIMQGLSIPTRLAEGEGLGLHRPSPSSSSPRSHR